MVSQVLVSVSKEQFDDSFLEDALILILQIPNESVLVLSSSFILRAGIHSEVCKLPNYFRIKTLVLNKHIVDCLELAELETSAYNLWRDVVLGLTVNLLLTDFERVLQQ
jgi:hypothetical protein